MRGTNKVCAQCQRACKQFAQMTLVNCPKFKLTPRNGDNSPPSTPKTKRVLDKIKKKVPFRVGGHKNLKSYHSTLLKAKGLCPVCRNSKAVSTHHIMPIAQGGEDTRKNIVQLCLSCHDIVETYTEQGKHYSPALVKQIWLTLL